MAVTSSGREVQMATIVSQITISETPSDFAREIALFTKNPPHKTSIINQIMVKKLAFKRERSAEVTLLFCSLLRLTIVM